MLGPAVHLLGFQTISMEGRPSTGRTRAGGTRRLARMPREGVAAAQRQADGRRGLGGLPKAGS